MASGARLRPARKWKLPTRQVFKNTGSVLDWLGTLNPFNLVPLAAMAMQNLDLVKYLLLELAATKEQQLELLRQFVPDAKAEDWTMKWAGQRLQVVKPDAKAIGKLQFGTEVVASKDRTIVGLLGASPGASVSPHIAIEVLDHFVCSKEDKMKNSRALSEMIPSYGRDLNAEPKLYKKVHARAKEFLLYGDTSGFRSSKKIMQKAFDKIDTNRDGSLSVKELRAHLRKQGVDRKTIDALIQRLDVDNSGDISREEFTSGFAGFVTGQLSKHQPS